MTSGAPFLLIYNITDQTHSLISLSLCARRGCGSYFKTFRGGGGRAQELRYGEATSSPHFTGREDSGFQRSRTLVSVFLGAKPYLSARLLLALTQRWNAEGQIHSK